MRILFLTSRLPFPPNRGDRVRTLGLLKAFAQEHTVTLVSFIENDEERELAAALAPYCENIVLVRQPAWKSCVNAALNIGQKEPMQAAYYHSQEMEEKIADQLSHHTFDAAYIHLFRMAPYFTNVSQIYRILDFSDLVSHEMQSSIPYQNAFWRAVYRIETPRIARYEQQIVAHCDEAWFINLRDRDLFLRQGAEAPLYIMPIIVDEAYFCVEREVKGAPMLLFVGHLEVKHNIDAASFLANEIMPIIRADMPDCELRIVGAGDTRAVESLDHLPGVSVVGYVPDLGAEYARSAILVAPLRFSAGVQVKVAEALAAGLPVVTTSGVVDGLGARSGEHVMMADDAGSFARSVLLLLQNYELRDQLSKAGRIFARTQFSERHAIGRLREIETLLEK